MIRRPPRSTLFPYRRSSDLNLDSRGDFNTFGAACPLLRARTPALRGWDAGACCALGFAVWWARYGRKRDRKSTRLNSSHLGISYAVFCLKKKIQNMATMDDM